MEELKPVAREALNAFDTIASAARKGLTGPGVRLDSFAQVNESTAERLAAAARDIREDRTANFQKLQQQPAIARLVVEDEDEKLGTLYITPAGTTDARSVRHCSYMSPMGRLAPLRVGDETEIRLPGGARWFTVREKMTFRPLEDAAGWDSQPAIYFQQDSVPLTIKSLRELLREDGFSDEEIDAVSQWLGQGDAESSNENISEGIKRDTLTAMQLRIAPLLDRIQDRIFRLPLDSQIAVLGPPGTGKTTTMVRRLRQKLDLEFLEDEEKDLVKGSDADGLEHADSWILFTPTELLRLYVKEALNKEGVPAHNGRLFTWEDYRWTTARDALGILRRASGGGLVMPRTPDDSWLAPEALTDQIGWFEAFDAWQAERFIQQLADEAGHLQNSQDPRASALGNRVAEAIARSSGDVLRLLGELLGFWKDLTDFAKAQGDGVKDALTSPVNAFVKADPEFLDALSGFVTEMLREAPDDTDEEEEDDTEDAEPVPTAGRRQVLELFRRAMRSLAIGQASGRLPAGTSRAGRILNFLKQRGLTAPALADAGRTLLLQRAAGRLAGAPATYLRRFSTRYREFRRAMRAVGRWYPETAGPASRAHPAEIDVIMLAMLRAGREIDQDRVLTARLAERRPPLLDAIAQLRRNQVLVDEMTDFSPVQLACMAALTSMTTSSLFLSGDFNQRLTLWGSRSETDLTWVAPGLTIERIAISYRQSRKLAEFACRLARLQGAEVDDEAPEFSENLGYDPVFGSALESDEMRARWLADRIREIESISDGQLPTIAVLVPDKEMLAPFTLALNRELAELSLQAKAYSEGESIGRDKDVRVFPIEHIKGLEFEAVFFLDVDRLAEQHPQLFDRYIYVGATRAATFLGLTTSGTALPSQLIHQDQGFGTQW